MTWREALADCKGTYILHGAKAAQELAAEYLNDRAIAVQDYIALARWTEGRLSYASRLWA